jgi:UDPglucose--hexose-1-phosphate uridylyltransferase
MKLFNLAEHSHRRYNLLIGEWVIVSPQRLRRPWLGQVEASPQENRPAYDPNCYLCPGNERAGGVHNPAYTGIYVFDNDFPALLVQLSPGEVDVGGLLMAEAERGICRVVCFSPRHDLTIPELELAALRQVVDAWAEQTEELGAHSFITYVQIFENKGAMMGASNPHPHCQIWATEHLPNEPAKELAAQLVYRADHGSCLLCDYLELEMVQGERLVCANEHFVALVPFWAVWPFETMVISRRHVSALLELTGDERDGLADVLKRLTARYDNLFRTSFPYSMGFHQRPTDGDPHPEWHLHLHFYPPLLRSATVRKFMVGFELLGTPQRDITAEDSAARLRAVSGRHYRSS